MIFKHKASEAVITGGPQEADRNYDALAVTGYRMLDDEDTMSEVLRAYELGEECPISGDFQTVEGERE